jgi:ADP-ribosylglycohydrolase
MSEDNFEKCIYNGILIPGNIINIGGLLGALYGLIYGTNNITPHMLEYVLKSINDDKILKLIKKLQ